MATTIQTIELPKKARALDTSGNNNHGQIYSGRGLEFDGVSDHLLTGYGNGLNPYTTPITVAIWAKTAGDTNMFIGPTNGTNQRFYIGRTGGLWDMGIQDSIWGSTTNEVSGFSDQPSAEVGVWYRIVIIMSAGQATMYVNGVKSYAKTYTSFVFNSDITIGSFGDNTDYYWNGMLSDAQIWDAAFTQADVTYDYLNPESLALNGGGTALTESNLKLWYPMQDGHRGQQSYILDGANTGLGDEKVTNGGFDGGVTDWNLGEAVWQQGSGNGEVKLTKPSSGNSVIYQTGLSFAANTVLRYRFDIVDYSGSSQIRLDGYSSSNPLNTSTSVIPSEGNVDIYVTTDRVGSAVFLYLTGGSVGDTVTIDNVSVKAINDKHHATTVFYGDTLWDAAASTNGSAANWQVFLNNTVATDSGAVKGTYVDAASGIYIYLKDSKDLSSDLTVGRTYQIQYDIKVNTGSVSPKISVSGGTTTSGDDITSTTFVTKTIDFICEHATDHYFWTGNMGAGEIVYLDNFSLKEVGVATGWTDADQQLHIPQTALQSYNELAWFDGVADYVDINPSTAIWNGSDGEWNSVSCWVNQNGDGTSGFYWLADGYPGVYSNVSGSNYKIGYNTLNGEVFGITIANTLVENKWNHWVMNWKRNSSFGAIGTSDVELFLNGVKQVISYQAGSQSNAAAIAPTSDINLMTMSGSGLFTSGIITEISTWKDQLTDAEVLELFNDGKALDALTHSNANLSAYWRNNGLSTWTNLVNPGTNDGTPTSVTETILIPQGVDSTRDAQGFIMNKQKDTSCLNLTNGSDKPYIDLGSVTTVADDEAFSFSAWLKPDDITNNYIFGLDSSNNLRIANATTISIAADGVAKHFAPPTAIVPGEWVHLAIVRKASNDLVTIYKNGVISTDTETLNEPFDYRYLGALDNTNNFRGQTDGILIYESELSAAEVLRNYNATKGSHRN